jgi:hypothetical protein
MRFEDAHERGADKAALEAADEMPLEETNRIEAKRLEVADELRRQQGQHAPHPRPPASTNCGETI